MTTGEHAIPQPDADLPPESAPSAARRDEAWLQALNWICLGQAANYAWEFWKYGIFFLDTESWRQDVLGQPWYMQYLYINLMLAGLFALVAFAAFFLIRYLPAVRKAALIALLMIGLSFLVGYLGIAYYQIQHLGLAISAASLLGVLRLALIASLGLPSVLSTGFMLRLAYRIPAPVQTRIAPEQRIGIPSPLMLFAAYSLPLLCIRFLLVN